MVMFTVMPRYTTAFDDKGKNDISVYNKPVIKKMYKLNSYANELFFCIKEFFPSNQWFLS